MRRSLRSIAFACVSLSAVTFAAGCGASSDEEPAPFAEPVETEADELAAADVDPAAEPIVDEEDLATDADGDVLLASYEGDVDDGAAAESDESDESDEAQLDTLSFNPLSATPTGEAVNGMKPRHCRVDGKVVSDCMCFYSPLNCQMPTTQRGRNRIIPQKLYAEMVARTDAKRAHPGSTDPSDIKTPVFATAWRIAPGTTVYDGNGVARGTIKEKYASGKSANECDGYEGTSGYEPVGQGGTCAKINFGLKKRMAVENGATMVYAFAVTTEGGGIVSGWVKLGAVAESQRGELQRMRTMAGKRIATSAFAPTSYVVKASGEYGPKLPAWTEGKVVKPNGTCEHFKKVEKNAKVGDYIVRTNDTWNLAFNTPGPGGISVDTFVVAKDALGFRRVRSTKARPTLVRVKVYCSSQIESMVFAYGAVGTRSGLRYGWAPLRALRKGAPLASAAASPAPGPAPAQSTEAAASNEPIPADFCAGKTDGYHCLGLGDESVGAQCLGGAAARSVTCPGGLRCVAANASNTNVTCSDR